MFFLFGPKWRTHQTERMKRRTGKTFKLQRLTKSEFVPPPREAKKSLGRSTGNRLNTKNCTANIWGATGCPRALAWKIQGTRGPRFRASAASLTSSPPRRCDKRADENLVLVEEERQRNGLRQMCVWITGDERQGTRAVAGTKDR